MFKLFVGLALITIVICGAIATPLSIVIASVVGAALVITLLGRRLGGRIAHRS